MLKKDDSISELYHALEESSFTVAITGAGISLSAGGVTFAGMMPNMGPAVLGHRDPEKTYKALYKTFLNIREMRIQCLRN